MKAPILEVQDLDVVFRRRRTSLFGSSGEIRAVDGISLALDAGRTLGVVGESGSGKSTLARAVLGLVVPTSGRILFDGAPLDPGRPIGRDAHMVFQDPFSSLNPRLTVGRSIAEPILSHEPHLRRSDIGDRVSELLAAVQLPPGMAHRRPGSMSGGQLQRVGIARAIAARPRLVVADEPVSALDVSVQAQILNLFADLQARLGVAYVFIGHNLAVVEHVADRIAVMFRGSLMEIGAAETVIGRPRHPYTQTLVRAVPRIDASAGDRRSVPETRRPVGEASATGCPFADRCPAATPRCLDERPRLRPMGADHLVACHHAEELSPVDPPAPHPPEEPPPPDHESTMKGQRL